MMKNWSRYMHFSIIILIFLRQPVSLFIHRNTLVYRLEKIQRKTGLDVRVFEDALTFKIAVMVEKHLKYLNNQ